MFTSKGIPFYGENDISDTLLRSVHGSPGGVSPNGTDVSHDCLAPGQTGYVVDRVDVISFDLAVRGLSAFDNAASGKVILSYGGSSKLGTMRVATTAPQLLPLRPGDENRVLTAEFTNSWTDSIAFPHFLGETLFLDALGAPISAGYLQRTDVAVGLKIVRPKEMIAGQGNLYSSYVPSTVVLSCTYDLAP
jgi:hypothetical protein